LPKYLGKKSKFSMFAVKAKAYLAMKFLGPTLKRTFKNLLPANDQVLLDQNKPKELAMLKSKEMNLHAMNIMTVMLSESDLMLMMIESSKSQDWPDGLAYVLWEKLLRKFKPSDQIAAAKQTVKLYALKLGKDMDPTVLEEKIASLGYGIPISKEMKISAVMKAAGKYYSDTIQSKTRAIKRAGGTVTCDDLIQAMTESFSIHGNKESDSKNEDNVTLPARSFSFNGNCNICGKQGHKASECCEKHKIKCEHYRRTGHKKEFCWKLEANKSKRPDWYMDNSKKVCVEVEDESGEIIL
jgi:hypothetical protein